VHKQIEFDRNLIRGCLQRCGNNLHGKVLWSRARITLPGPLYFFAAKIRKSEQKIRLTWEHEHRTMQRIIQFASEPIGRQILYDGERIGFLFDSRSEFKFK
jgi:hypothetical protein